MNNFIFDKNKYAKVRASTSELFSVKTAITSDKIYTRDFDNNYPARIEKVINNSPTGKRASSIMSTFILGRGVENDKVVNSKGETMNDIAKKACDDISTFYGVFFHLLYSFDEDGELKVSDIFVLDYVDIVKSKEDDDENFGIFYKLEKDEYRDIKKINNKKFFYPYNSEKRVVVEQMKRDCKISGIKNPSPEDLIRNYRGQIFYLNLTPKRVYALPPWDVVYNDMDTESRISIYHNKQVRRGWLGHTLIKKISGSDEDNEIFEDKVNKALGSENSSDIFFAHVEMNGFNRIDDAITVEQLKPQFDDKLFESTSRSIKRNIIGAFNNIPEQFIFAGEGALFSTGGDTFREMKKFYWEQNESERKSVERALSNLSGSEVKFLPIVEEYNEEELEKSRRKEIQRIMLSHGNAIEKILEISSNANKGAIRKEAGELLLSDLYGIDKKTIKKLII